MSYETEEQQVERLKEWWKENGTPLVVGAILGLAGFGGWKYWNEQKAAYLEAASDAYIKVTEILESDKKDGLKDAAELVKKDYPDSTYAILSAFHLAKLAVEAADLDLAASQLNWVVEKHANNELAPVAKIRLARVYLAQNKLEPALALLNVEESSRYYELANVIKGDVLVALDRKSEALTAYKAAMAKISIVAQNPTLQIKIDQLGQSTGDTGEAL